MATSRRKKKGQLALKLGINDERVPKLLGLLALLLAFYLLIAFTSYIFTWQIDQDLVLRSSWSELFTSDRDIANWLGRLGAVVSNWFFFWGFGFPSYVIIWLLSIYGVDLIKRRPLAKNRKILVNSLIVMLFFSVFLAFLSSSDAEFPWGGAIGEGISDWLVGFLGTIGMILFLLFILVGFVVWFLNPNFNELTREKAATEARYWWNDLVTRRPRKPLDYLKRTMGSQQAKSLQPNAEKLSEDTEVVPESTEKPLLQGEQSELDFETLERRTKSTESSSGDTELEIEVNEQEPGESMAPDEDVIKPDLVGIDQPNADHMEPYDPTLDLSSYEHPTLSLLVDYADEKFEVDRAELEANKDQIIATLLNYKIEITKIRATIGPTVTLYEIVPAPGVRISRIKNLEDDIALSLAALGIRIIAPIPGRGTIGIEVPNKRKQIVSLKEVLMSEKFKRAKMDLPIALGKTISNEVSVVDLAKMPHLLIAGATGQGKSVGINTVLMSLLYKKHPSQVKLVLIDPKKVELFPYANLEHHFLGCLPDQDEPIITETSKVVNTLNSLCIEMDNRYDLLKKAQVRNIKEYNEKFVARRLNPEKGHRFLPFIVLVIDEFADLIMTAGKEIEMPIGRLAQLARAVGIHLIIATQRPSVNIITGVIKANFPARLAFKVASKVDSRTILDAGGAEQLIGRGDMLLSVGSDIVRLQCAFVDTPEVERVLQFISDQRGYPTPYLLPEFHGDDDMQGSTNLKYSDLDEMFEDAARLVVQNQHGSTSMIQRRLKLGYNRAGRIMDQLEAMGVVGPSEGSKAREVLVFTEVELEKYINDLRNSR